MNKTGTILVICMLLLISLQQAAAIPDAPHPDFDLEALDLPFNGQDFLPLVMGMDVLSNGDMVVVTSDDLIRGGSVVNSPTNASAVYRVSGLEAGAGQTTVREIDRGFLGLSGVVVVNDKIYVADRDALYELVNSNGDPDIESRRRVITWPAGPAWHQWAFTPMYYEGHFYVPWSGTITLGGPSTTEATHSLSGGFLKFDSSGNNLEAMAGGLRSPNGSGLGPGGAMLVADNQGSWLPASTLSFMREGTSNGHLHPTRTDLDLLEYALPTAWLPNVQISRSPSEPLYIDRGPYEGQWLFGDINHQGLKRVYLDTVNGEPQGAVFPFSRGMNRSNSSAAVNRLVWGPDDALYIGSDGRIAGNWSSTDVLYPLYRFKHKGTNTFDLKSVRSRQNGFELEFTKAVDAPASAAWNFSVRQWTYTRNENYGAGKSADENLSVTQVLISDDMKRVMLEIPGLKDQGEGTPDVIGRREGFVTYINVEGVQSAELEDLWNGEVWYTLNTISPDAFDPAVPVERPLANRNDFNLRVREGQYTLQLDKPGLYTVTIRNLKGKIIQSQRVEGGRDHTFFAPSGIHGVYLLGITGEAGDVHRKIFFRGSPK